MTNFPLPPGAVEAACDAYADAAGYPQLRMEAAIQAALQWCVENGVAKRAALSMNNYNSQMLDYDKQTKGWWVAQSQFIPQNAIIIRTDGGEND